MLNDLNKNDWLSLLNIPAGKIPRVLVLRGTRNLKKKYHEHKFYFDNIFEVTSPNNIVEDIFIGDIDGVAIAYASVYGAPMASELTHIFGVLGTELVIQTGCCGSIGDEVNIGDIVCATSVFCGEGASQYYLNDATKIQTDNGLLKTVGDLILETVPIHYGPVYTTSALLAENAADVKHWNDEGYIAVDMETAATFAVAKSFNMDYLSLLFVFDSPGNETHILTTDKVNEKKRTEGELVMLGMVLTIIESMFSYQEKRK
jgi:purine-nucleoside phosphorylase